MWYKIIDDKVYIDIKAKPNAKVTQLLGLQDDRLKVGLKALPVAGQANEELVRFFAEQWRLPKNALALTSGKTSAMKRLSVSLTPTVKKFLVEIDKL